MGAAMNSGYHEGVVKKLPGRLLPAKLIAVTALLSSFAFGQAAVGQKTPENVVCPLSHSQQQKSMEAFGKIASAIGQEDRCLGCHGRVNPFIDGTGPDPANPDAPASEFEHGPGKVDHGADCDECHSNMARRSGGGVSHWMTAPDFLAFVGRDSTTLCKQIRDILHTGKDFLGHIRDDNGGNNFAGTAFNGDRGLDRKMFPEKEVPTQKPHISHAALEQLGRDWITAMGGEFKGDKGCGCEPEHFAVLFSSTTEIAIQGLTHSSVMGPAKIPLTFKDDGTFQGDGNGTFDGGGTAGDCAEQSTLSLPFHATGHATETSVKQDLDINLEFAMPMALSVSTNCPDTGGDSYQANLPAANVKLPIKTNGKVGEKIVRSQNSTPGFVTKTEFEIIKLDEAPGP